MIKFLKVWMTNPYIIISNFIMLIISKYTIFDKINKYNFDLDLFFITVFICHFFLCVHFYETLILNNTLVRKINILKISLRNIITMTAFFYVFIRTIIALIYFLLGPPKNLVIGIFESIFILFFILIPLIIVFIYFPMIFIYYREKDTIEKMKQNFIFFKYNFIIHIASSLIFFIALYCISVNIYLLNIFGVCLYLLGIPHFLYFKLFEKTRG